MDERSAAKRAGRTHQEEGCHEARLHELPRGCSKMWNTDWGQDVARTALTICCFIQRTKGKFSSYCSATG